MKLNGMIGLAAGAAVAFGMSVQARADVAFDVQSLQTTLMVQAMASPEAGLNWHVGDKASYKLNIAGFINGTSDNSVTQDTGTDFWMEQDMNLQIQKQKVEVEINKSTGQIDKLLVDGKEQTVPKADTEILDMHEDHITVAAGTFDCVYAKIRDKSNNQITEAWINPKVVPMTGMLKAIADSQLGKVNQEVTSMSFAPVAPAPAPIPPPAQPAPPAPAPAPGPTPAPAPTPNPAG